jgi:DNA-binding transcriptional LysR family regulator
VAFCGKSAKDCFSDSFSSPPFINIRYAARAAAQDAEMILNIGRTPFADPFFTSTLLATKLPLYPRLKLNLSSGFSCDLAHEVLSGELDAALVIEPPESSLLTGLKIDESSCYAVISQEDELANYPALTLDQLTGKRWLLFQRRSHPPLYDLIRKLAQESRVIPSAIQHFMVPEELSLCSTIQAEWSLSANQVLCELRELVSP